MPQLSGDRDENDLKSLSDSSWSPVKISSVRVCWRTWVKTEDEPNIHLGVVFLRK